MQDIKGTDKHRQLLTSMPKRSHSTALSTSPSSSSAEESSDLLERARMRATTSAEANAPIKAHAAMAMFADVEYAGMANFE
mmetsp:Transcript_98019/g.169848  ORF Transcript_98019/g.169848 Transcript_98019/m.169848 type:complete len:81 (-) Transcript_98019:487-729(-)